MDYLEHLVLLGIDGVIIVLSYYQYRKLKTLYSEFVVSIVCCMFIIIVVYEEFV